MNGNIKTKASLLMIYTGGTIGMKQDPADMTLKPFNFGQILEEVPELGKFAYRIDSFSFALRERSLERAKAFGGFVP